MECYYGNFGHVSAMS